MNEAENKTRPEERQFCREKKKSLAIAKIIFMHSHCINRQRTGRPTI